MSASDDRSVRVWTVKLTAAEQTDVKQQQAANPEAAPVLYGHSARLWDCQFGKTILITASEDCTARCVSPQQTTHASAVFMVRTWMRLSDDLSSVVTVIKAPWQHQHSIPRFWTELPTGIVHFNTAGRRTNQQYLGVVMGCCGTLSSSLSPCLQTNTAELTLNPRHPTKVHTA